jgi:acetyl-CoA acetyltransferase
MQFQNVFIPYGGYWSTPFVRWQGNFAGLHPLTFAAGVAQRALAERKIPPAAFEALYLGTTVPSPHAFYGAPWVAALIGAEGITGPTFSQACATSARVIGSAAFEVETRPAVSLLCLTADRTSNGPHLTYPNPNNAGARPDTEDWVWDNFNYDPAVCNAMIETAENVAREEEITTEEQHEVMLMRYAQYQDALKDDAAFHKRYMITPVEASPSGKNTVAAVKDDEGVFPTTPEGLAKLKPVLPNGTVTFGAQTYPADGNAGMIVTRHDRAAEFSRASEIEIQIVSFAQGRAKKGFMPEANVPAAQRALELAGLTIGEVKAIKTHNPFAVSDIYFARAMGVKQEAMNNFGSSLVWGHPQAPTGMRLVIELIEELVLLGGGHGLFTGCAAGDTAAAIVVRVGDQS